jgi:hypothetical protein
MDTNGLDKHTACLAKTNNTCTDLYHSFIKYAGSYTFQQWSAIIRELLGSIWVVDCRLVCGRVAPMHLGLMQALCALLLVPSVNSRGVPRHAGAESSISEGRRSGKKWPTEFCLWPNFHVITGFFNMQQICDMGQTALLPFRRKACCPSELLEKQIK